MGNKPCFINLFWRTLPKSLKMRMSQNRECEVFTAEACLIGNIAGREAGPVSSIACLPLASFLLPYALVYLFSPLCFLTLFCFPDSLSLSFSAKKVSTDLLRVKILTAV